MPEKLLTLDEISAYLGLDRENVVRLVESGIIPAYKIGGSHLRFRKEQVDAIRGEILNAAAGPGDRAKADLRARAAGVSAVLAGPDERESVGDMLRDFLYFNDFYIVCILIGALLLCVVFRL
ncbi:MAG: helix-turn-helix domain-containing protein [Candidatus Omnitrophota bacterium]